MNRPEAHPFLPSLQVFFSVGGKKKSVCATDSTTQQDESFMCHFNCRGSTESNIICCIQCFIWITMDWASVLLHQLFRILTCLRNKTFLSKKVVLKSYSRLDSAIRALCVLQSARRSCPTSAGTAVSPGAALLPVPRFPVRNNDSFCSWKRNTSSSFKKTRLGWWQWRHSHRLSW